MYGKLHLNAAVCNINVILRVLYFAFLILINNALNTILQQQFATCCYTLSDAVHYERLLRKPLSSFKTLNNIPRCKQLANNVPIHYRSAISINDFAVE